MTDEIRLVLPAEEDFRPVAHLVVGGLGARHDLTFEDLEDLQVAVEALLSRRDDAGDVTITIEIDAQAVRATIGPLPPEALVDLEGAGEELGLRRVLDTVCDSVEVDEDAGGARVSLSKHVRTASRSEA